MQGSVLVELLEPVLGKQGQVRLVVRGLNGRWTLNDDKHPLLGVQQRPDGLLEFTRDDGWSILDPGDVLAVEWISRDTEGQGQYL
ncbi:MAG TPA: hypothetical protein VH089_19055 [Streptosporangiaceae bacterium]|nr:hypothetical protein [Streptosporangiaceae bacterium]